MLKDRLNILEANGIIPANALNIDSDIYANAKTITNLTMNENDEEFNEIVEILKSYAIVFKDVSILYYRLFTMEPDVLKTRIEAFASLDELGYVKQNPYILAEKNTSEGLVEEIKQAHTNGTNYRYVDENGYIAFDFGGVK